MARWFFYRTSFEEASGCPDRRVCNTRWRHTISTYRRANKDARPLFDSSTDTRYDNAASRTHLVEANGDRVTWSYDDTYQLTAERRSGANAYCQTFVHDRVGNRLVKNADGSRTTTVYDAANQIEYSVDASGRTTYMFDANGNQEVVAEPSRDRAPDTELTRKHSCGTEATGQGEPCK